MSREYAIFVFEDSREDIFLIREALLHAAIKHQLTILEDVRTLGHLLDTATAPPDLFLIDLNLPKQDGFEVLSAIREDSRCELTPVILMSSSNSPKVRKRAGEFGVRCYFCKPIDLDEFMKLGGMVREAFVSRNHADLGLAP